MWLIVSIIIVCGPSTAWSRDAVTDALHEIGRLYNYSGALDYDLGFLSSLNQTGSLLDFGRRSFAAQVAERATYKLKRNKDMAQKASMEALCPLRRITCNFSRYRSITGM
ncbi:hypothetical protein GCK32_017754 [Trichostrongylus colubriformis]|uniref:Uncharacterized protein n=1 Tax=Trichostrongylus colubriformis TaxID=6319 RepID=A0AAN8IDJ2_TRICO